MMQVVNSTFLSRWDTQRLLEVQTHGECVSKSLARLRAVVVTCCIALILPVVASGQTLKSTYPRIGAYEIAGTHETVKPEYRQALARHDIVIMGMWLNWSGTDTASGQLLNMRDVVVDIKRRASQMGNGQMLIGKYTMYMESGTDSGNSSPHNERWQKLTDNDWWARKTNGEKTSSYPGNSNTNMTEYVRRDSNGDTWPEWAAKRDFEWFFRDVPELDIWFIDNWFHQPRVTADWDGDGSNDDKNSAAVGREYRKGFLNGLRRIRELASDKIVIGNVDGEPQSGKGMLTEPEYKGEISSLYEGAIGYNWSTETWGGWEAMMEQYQTTLANSRNRLSIMTVHGDANDYALMRYGLASCLMDDGYYYYTTHETEYRSALWFDEYDIDLGRAIDPPQFSPWQKGVYRRRFENGIVLVNPKGNGSRTIDLEPGYSRIDGTQDRSTNNGQSVVSVSLGDRDGIILLSGEANRGTRPKPPQLISR